MAGRAAWRQVDGILLVDKPARIGSTAVLQHVRRLYQAARAGHTGTLDPMASGLLVVCFGEGTKFAGELLDAPKTYGARLTLGIRTTTADAEGEVTEQRPVQVDRASLEAVLDRFRGAIRQVPPMHSALKRDGRPLYDYARKGETVHREPRDVVIHALDLVALELPEVELEVSCSKGTYIRTLAEDIGAELGCGAHLSGLVRTRVGAFKLEAAHSPEAIGALTPGERDRLLLPPDRMLHGYPEVRLDPADVLRFTRGQAVSTSRPSPGLVRVYGDDTRFLGTGWAEGDCVRPRRLVSTTQAADA